jgi:hypothetical protein
LIWTLYVSLDEKPQKSEAKCGRHIVFTSCHWMSQTLLLLSLENWNKCLNQKAVSFHLHWGYPHLTGSSAYAKHVWLLAKQRQKSILSISFYILFSKVYGVWPVLTNVACDHIQNHRSPNRECLTRNGCKTSRILWITTIINF